MFNKTFFDDLLSEFLKNKSKNDLINFLYGILTPKEIEQLSTRLQIVKKLKKGENQLQISKELKVGIATVTRGSRELKFGRFKTV